jgi:hypothetical protein
MPPDFLFQGNPQIIRRLVPYIDQLHFVLRFSCYTSDLHKVNCNNIARDQTIQCLYSPTNNVNLFASAA